MRNDVFMYPHLLPSQPFRSDFPKKLEFVHSEDCLIAIGLEQFCPYAQKYPQWHKGRQGMDLIASDLIHDFLLTAKSAKQIVRRIRTMKIQEGNPIWVCLMQSYEI